VFLIFTGSANVRVILDFPLSLARVAAAVIGRCADAVAPDMVNVVVLERSKRLASGCRQHVNMPELFRPLARGVTFTNSRAVSWPGRGLERHRCFVPGGRLYRSRGVAMARRGHSIPR